jgi:Fe-S-cluster containining protein
VVSRLVKESHSIHTLVKTLDGNEHRISTDRIQAIPCFRCGECCTYLLVKLTPQDMQSLAHGLGVSRNELLRKYVRKTPVGPVLRQAGDRCIFLEMTGGVSASICRAYGFRPEVCRGWAPELSCPECIKGLSAMGKAHELLLPEEMYESEDDIAALCSAIRSEH